MSYARRLDRGLDTDLIARMEASGRPKPPRPVRKKEPRPAHTYRGAIRNEPRLIRAAALAAKRNQKQEQP